MKHSEGRITGCDGGSLYTQNWQPETDCRAVILLAHGMGEHCGRYVEFAEFFVARGFAVYALDHVGHGKSDGTPGFVPRFSDFVDSLKIYADEVKSAHPDKPLILVGHSMGGLISTLFVQQHGEMLDACVLSGPALTVAIEIGGFQQFMMNLLSAIAPKLGVMQLDASGVSRDPEVVKKYIEDPLVFSGKIPSRTAKELLGMMPQAMANAASIKLPMLIMHGTADELTAVDGSKELYEKISSNEKHLILYDGLYHEIFNEPEREKVMTDMAEWLDKILV
jgi:alpha-beta hydrolase superfamily lysophospholipase